MDDRFVIEERIWRALDAYRAAKSAGRSQLAAQWLSVVEALEARL